MASSAQIAANRANAQRSSGPRSPEGKARAASNSFKHGLYAPKHFQVLNADPNFTSALIHNLSDEFQPVTPSEHILLQQLVHQQIRYQHIQAHYTVLINYYASKPGTPKTTLVCQEELEDALSFERLANDTKVLPLLLRELDRMPTRIRRTMEALRKQIKERIEADLKIERNEANSDEPDALDQIDDLRHIPMRPDPSATRESTSESTHAENQGADPALRARLKGLPGNYLWNLLLHYTFEDHPDELAYFYSELEAEKAEIEATKAEAEKQEKLETNPIAA